LGATVQPDGLNFAIASRSRADWSAALRGQPTLRRGAYG